MKIGRIIHQQMMQLRWHFLACLGLLMALPIEEALINLRDGEGFYASGLSLGIPLMAAPLLAGLIACSNVQADLDDRRYIFWRSKPVGIKSFMAIKYFVGLIVAAVVVDLPILFAIVSSKVAQSEIIENGFDAYIVNIMLISLLAYSLCFCCNVLVRKTARAWLIGMAMTVFLLLVPFILPLNFKDMRDFILAASVVYFFVTVVPSFIAFAASLLAASRNWHLKSNLKGLLWTGAGLIFVIMLLFTRQVANIKVLDEVEGTRSYSNTMQKDANGSITWGDQYVNVKDNRIVLTQKQTPSQESLERARSIPPLYKVPEGFRKISLPLNETWDVKIGDSIYFYRLYAYFSRQEQDSQVGKDIYKNYEHVYLVGHHFEDLVPMFAVDLSDLVENKNISSLSVYCRVIDENLCIYINGTFIAYKIDSKGQLHELERHRTKKHAYNFIDRNKIFKIPLISSEHIKLQDRIRFSLNLNYWAFYARYDYQFTQRSYVDVRSYTDEDNDTIFFCTLDDFGIERYDVVKWDEDYVYCQLRDARQFTFLEQMFGQLYWGHPHFLQDGKLYAFSRIKLMVFDVSSDRIRKLGHFERISDNFDIYDIEVLDDGNILMSADTGLHEFEDGSRSTMNSLYLLKNPE